MVDLSKHVQGPIRQSYHNKQVVLFQRKQKYYVHVQIALIDQLHKIGI